MTTTDHLKRFERATVNPYNLICSFTLKRPPTTNHLYLTLKSGKRVKSKEYREWLKFANPDLIEQMIKCGIYNQQVIDCPVSVLLTIEPKTRRKMDAGNFEKAITDLMVYCGVFKDDSIIRANTQTIDWDKLGGDKIHYDIYGV